MKTKDKDRQESRSTSNGAERSPDRDEKLRDEQTNRSQRSSAENDLEKTLSRGYFPDGPGGNYRGV